jgi:hypothetical protein
MEDEADAPEGGVGDGSAVAIPAEAETGLAWTGVVAVPEVVAGAEPAQAATIRARTPTPR